jgi:deoxyxylulose-5-phosphate synthase
LLTNNTEDIEEGAIGGFGSAVVNFLHQNFLLDDGNCKFRSFFMDDKFIEQNSIENMRIDAGLGVDNIFEKISQIYKLL